ncbi:prevent-host-death family protein [Antricoccus suffuscus]|uniref:Prevent-host-death family protein n=1 Tax=Antricoccus suffuscus TaxID=1629062 RepID=A0A2T0ZXB4_9ACTN|nr:type II toxin-antitoxin system prevent-host-death family antitoxin [Antricoccus suffuscus]PRZ41005.1 prevent-host-death family protein [Antricoccus suffuscus]
MDRVSKRDLNQHTASVLDRVIETGDVVVTERGVPRWRVSPFQGQDAPLGRMEHDGRYTPPTPTPAPWPSSPGGPKYTDADVDALFDEMHGDH